MNIDEFMQQLSSSKGVSNISKIRKNTVKLDLTKKESLDFFVSIKSEFEHCSLISAIDNQPDFELVYHFSCMNQSIVVDDSNPDIDLAGRESFISLIGGIDQINFTNNLHRLATGYSRSKELKDATEQKTSSETSSSSITDLPTLVTSLENQLVKQAEYYETMSFFLSETSCVTASKRRIKYNKKAATKVKKTVTDFFISTFEITPL